MATNRQTLNVSELDFDSIKQNLANYFSRPESPFRDWNFEGAGLNNILDVLAYNTHYNSMQAHLAVSESFIDSAQLRSSVVSLAKLLGYTPRSYTSPTSTLSVSFVPKGELQSSITLEKGSTFSTTINDTKFVYVTDDEHDLPIDGNGNYSNSSIKVRQGSYQTKRLQINRSVDNDSPAYVIDDENIDLSTLVVKVFPNSASTSAEIYSEIADISDVDGTSNIYFINENIDSNYQISFGNGVLGKRPGNLSVIELSYLVNDGDASNGASAFVYTDTISVYATSNPSVTTISRASGGSSKEGIESIRYNAPLSFVTQNRAVTGDDYKNLLLKQFGDLETVSVWGGEDNDPPIYGKVFISVKPSGADIVSDSTAASILAFLKGKKSIGIFPELVNPEYLSITLDVLFKYNKNLTSNSRGQLENEVRDLVQTYNDEQLQAFDRVFRYSSLTLAIDTMNAAMINSHIRVYVTKKIVLSPENITKKTINFATRLIDDDGKVIISSSPFRLNGIDTYLGDEPIDGDSDVRRLYTYFYKDGVQEKIGINAGSLNMRSGLLLLEEIDVDAEVDLVIDVLPYSNDIVPKRNQLLQIDINRAFIRGEVDIIAQGGSSRSVDYAPFKRDR